MANRRPTHVNPELPDASASDLPLDHALSLLLADETENALRWGAAVLESGPWTPSALVVTARLLNQMGRKRAAIEGLSLAVQQATAEGNLPLAMAATGDLRTLGADVEDSLDRIASAFCEGSDRIEDTLESPLLPQLGEFRPLSPFLTGPALASKAAQIVQSARRAGEAVESTSTPQRIPPLPLFSSLGKEPLHDLLAAFDTLTVPAGHAVIREGEEEAAAYIVARGELEVSRRSTDESGKPVVLARLASGAFFGEMAILSQLPGAASVIATRPSILLVAKREALEAVVEKHPSVATELAAHCRRQSVANLGWASPVVVAIPAREREALVERFETRMFEAGDKLVEAGEAPLGLHLVVSGEVAVVAHEAGERVVLANLTAGETVGEVELVLCRNTSADAIAVRPTATLFLQRDEFFALVQDHPAILHGLYGIAVRRQAETSRALEAGSAAVGDESLLGEVPGNLTALLDHPAPNYGQPTIPARIAPLARGTFGTSRLYAPTEPLEAASATRTPASNTSQSASPLPKAASLPPPPSRRTATARTTLPLPPAPVPTPRSSSYAAPSSSRGSLPPPIPPSTRPQTATLSGTGGASMAPSIAPVTSSDGLKRQQSTTTHSPRTWATVALVAAAAAAVAVVSMRSSHEDIAVPATQAAAPQSPVTQAPATWTPSGFPVRTEPTAAAALATPSEPASQAPYVLATKPKSVSPAPAGTRGHVPATSPRSETSVSNALPAAPSAAAAAAASLSVAASAPSPARAAFQNAKPPVADQALTAGEFGGRE